MSTYFVTGATGITGRGPVERLLLRHDRDRVYALVRSRPADKLGPLADHDKLTTVPDDLRHRVDVEGTRHVLDRAPRSRAKLGRHVSEITVAGDHPGAVGGSHAGGIDEVDGPDHFFPTIAAPAKTTTSLARWAYRAMPEQGGHHRPPAPVAAGVTRPVPRAAR